MAVKPLREVYQFKVTLQGSKPPIWRRILVPSTMTLPKFHDVLQITMGWSNSHLHQFIVNGNCYGIIDPDFGADLGDYLIDERRVKLAQLFGQEKEAISYEYDFGDGWEHRILLEKILPFDNTLTLPQCIKGKRACPPEDCGGIWGYQDLLEAINDPSHPDHESMLDWVGGEFEPEWLDIEEVNGLLTRRRR